MSRPRLTRDDPRRPGRLDSDFDSQGIHHTASLPGRQVVRCRLALA
ncbi:hypothetical protein SAMN05216466_114183 [Paraburkholderia phenazinium]|uniref:Uncharacterized protein n=1 Tax=Paraburkholderia phenazinium TaxID=60549 RepID=A0A1G8G949_9BURK|nr:hypothetical protein SAMN05216466_114183 [Paraburkholderia phenazinium]